MTDTGSNPFAEPDFSALRNAGVQDATDEDYNDDEDLEDEEFDDEELDEDDDLDNGGDEDAEEDELAVPDHAGHAPSCRRGCGQPRGRGHRPFGARARGPFHRRRS